MLTEPSRAERLLLWYSRSFPIQRGKLRVVNSLWRLVLGDRGTFRLATLRHGGFRMNCDISQMLQRQYYFFGTYVLEEGNLRCWQAQAREAKVVFDVGANAGIYSLAAHAVRPDAEIHAFEPTAEMAELLRRTSLANGLSGIHVHQQAVLDKVGSASLVRCGGRSSDNEGMNYIPLDVADPSCERVQTVSLDQFCSDHEIDRIDLLKLDIQGQEATALKGAAQLLKDGRIGTVFAELNWAENSSETCPASESIGLLERAGYQFAAPGARLDWRRSGEWMRALRDVVARRTSS